MAAAAGPLVAGEGIVKRFGSAEILHGVDFDLRPGEVHAVVGANGSGKSTLMKVIYGAHRPNRGELRIGGQRVTLRNPGHALKLGIAPVPQELPLFPHLSVAENVVFGHPPRRRGGIVDWRATRRAGRAALAEVDPDGAIDPEAPAGSLPVSARQLVSIARALSLGARVLVLDEPTSALHGDAVARLAAVVRSLRDGGRAVALVSQRLDDVFTLADRITVLRDGRAVARLDPARTTPGEVAELMTGTPVLAAAAGQHQDGPAGSVLEVRELARRPALHPVSFRIAPGEILGIAGLPGCGAEELLTIILGRQRPGQGTVTMEGRDITGWPLRRRLSRGLAYISGDRAGEGLVLSQTVAFNLTMTLNRRARLLPLRPGPEAASVRGVIDELGITPASPHAITASLSGGNQQKIVFGRCLLARPAVWLLNDPTRGVDVRARAEIHRLVRREVAQRGGALVISSDLPELIELCDRVLVMSRGEVIAEEPARGLTEHRLLALAGGAAAAGGRAERGITRPANEGVGNDGA